MRIVLRCKESGRYVLDKVTRTDSPEKAFQFENVTEAQRYCRANKINGVAIIQYGNETYQVNIDCSQVL